MCKIYVDILGILCQARFNNERTVISLERNAIENLMEWKASEERKAMVLKGVRQVGNNVKLEIM